VNTNKIRERFEKWISSEPFGRSILRNSLDETVSAWPGQYSDMNTEVAWLAYQAAHAEAGRGMGEVVGILQELVDYPNETSVSDCERALWAEARALLARLKKGEL